MASRLLASPARLGISGKATLGPPSEGLDLTLTAQRLDAPGDFKALLTYIPATDRLTLNVNSVRAGRRNFRPSRQSSRAAAGQARLQWRRRA